MNRNFGKLEDGRFTYAPSVIMTTRGLAVLPTADDYLSAGWKRVVDTPPVGDGATAPVASGWLETADAITRQYEMRPVPARPVRVSKAKVATLVDSMDLTAAFFAWLNSRASYITAWFDGSPSVPYDADDNASDLASLIAALGIYPDDVPALIEKVKEAK